MLAVVILVTAVTGLISVQANASDVLKREFRCRSCPCGGSPWWRNRSDKIENERCVVLNICKRGTVGNTGNQRRDHFCTRGMVGKHSERQVNHRILDVSLVHTEQPINRRLVSREPSARKSIPDLTVNRYRNLFCTQVVPPFFYIWLSHECREKIETVSSPYGWRMPEVIQEDLDRKMAPVLVENQWPSYFKSRRHPRPLRHLQLMSSSFGGAFCSVSRFHQLVKLQVREDGISDDSNPGTRFQTFIQPKFLVWSALCSCVAVDLCGGLDSVVGNMESNMSLSFSSGVLSGRGLFAVSLIGSGEYEIRIQRRP